MRLSLAFTIFFLFLPLSAEAADLGCPALLQTARSMLQGSAPAEAYERAIAAAAALQRAQLAESPWTVRTAASHTQYKRNAETLIAGSPVLVTRNFDTSFSAGLDFVSRFGFGATLEGMAYWIDETAPPQVEQRSLAYDASLTVRYDLLRGGSKSPANERARANSLAALAQKMRALDALELSERALVERIAMLFGARCKKDALEAHTKANTELLRSAEIQLKARVLSQTDLLNFRSLENSLRARSDTVELERARLLHELSAWGPELANEVRGAMSKPISCTPDLEALIARAQERARKKELAEALAERLPAHVEAEASRKSALSELEAVSKEQRPLLAPFAAGRALRPQSIGEDVASADVGIRFEWTFPTERQEELEEAARREHEAAVLRKEQARLAGLAQVHSLLSNLEGYARLLKTLTATMKDTDLLIRALDVGRSIGEAASFNLATAYIDRADTELQTIDAWTRIYAALEQLAVMEQMAMRTEAENQWTD